MVLNEFLEEKLMSPCLRADTQGEVLHELSSVLCTAYPSLKQDAVMRVLQEREALGSTAMGNGVAIPHGKMQGLPRCFVVVGTTEKGIDYGASDDVPCTIFFLLLSPEGEAGHHLSLLAQIARRAKNSILRSKLLLATTPAQLYTTITMP